MSCCICNRAGHDEELHGAEGREILELREEVLRLRLALERIYRGDTPAHKIAANALTHPA